MYEGREMALQIALKAVLATARKQGLDVDALAEAAADSLIVDPAYSSWYVSEAILEIEKAVDALPVESSGPPHLEETLN
ncbi:hypothetical protein [Pseudomonas sp. LP_7_YM]|uniref:hypothetical protein n=1 Tax=Pseudomonas sp. LP_7_YM TaxID=2485137 RepID=UPI00105ED89A|nr:hypothetical protein [Pseudomonas sp. LP_7_YM]TDV67802.1 hypothetical protein EC915_103339 [Pseudomonas sp. LP_7_YM]